MKVNEYEIIRLKHDVDKNHRRSHSEVVRDIKYTFVAISDYMGEGGNEYYIGMNVVKLFIDVTTCFHIIGEKIEKFIYSTEIVGDIKALNSHEILFIISESILDALETNIERNVSTDEDEEAILLERMTVSLSQAYELMRILVLRETGQTLHDFQNPIMKRYASDIERIMNNGDYPD